MTKQETIESIASFVLHNNIDTEKHSFDKIFRGWLAAQNRLMEEMKEQLFEAHRQKR